MRYGFMGDPNSRGGPQNLFGGDPGLFPFFLQTGNPGMGMFRQRSVTPGMGPQGRAGFPQSSPLYGGGGIFSGMQNPVQGQFSRSPYGFGPGPAFDATQAGLPSTTTNFGMNPNIRSGAVVQDAVNAPAYGQYFVPQIFRNVPQPPSPQEGYVGGRSQSMNPFAAQRNPNLEPRQMATTEKAMERNYREGEERQKRNQENMQTFRRRQARTNETPPRTPAQPRRQQLPRFGAKQTPRRRAASSAGEG